MWPHLLSSCGQGTQPSECPLSSHHPMIHLRSDSPTIPVFLCLLSPNLRAGAWPPSPGHPIPWCPGSHGSHGSHPGSHFPGCKSFLSHLIVSRSRRSWFICQLGAFTLGHSCRQGARTLAEIVFRAENWTTTVKILVAYIIIKWHIFTFKMTSIES